MVVSYSCLDVVLSELLFIPSSCVKICVGDVYDTGGMGHQLDNAAFCGAAASDTGKLSGIVAAAYRPRSGDCLLYTSHSSDFFIPIPFSGQTAPRGHK